MFIFSGFLSSLAFFALAASPSFVHGQHLSDLAERKHWPELRDALNRDALNKEPSTVNEAQPDGMTALHWATVHSEHQAIEILLAVNASVNAENHYRVRPLSIACSNGDFKAVDQLLKARADVNARGNSQETPLMIAARQGNVHVVNRLLDFGASVEASDGTGQTSLMWAAAAGNADALHALMKAGADKDKSLPSGFNPFFFAVRQGHGDVVQALIDAGTDVNEPMKVKKAAGRHPMAQNTSALMLAIDNGHFELALRLVDLGADPNDQRSGFAPLHAISWVRKPDRGEDNEPPVRGSGNVGSLEFVRRIVEKGADVNLAIEHGRSPGAAKLNSDRSTPLLYAAKTADTQLMKLLVELGADIHAANVDGVTPLLAAAGVGITAVDEEAGTEPEVLEAIAYLIEKGAQIDTNTNRGDTAMHGAAFRAFPEVIRVLQHHGLASSIWNHKNALGWSPFDIADGKRPGSVKPNPAVRRALEEAL